MGAGYTNLPLCKTQQGYSPQGEGESSAAFLKIRATGLAGHASAKPETCQRHSFSPGEKARMRAVVKPLFLRRGATFYRQSPSQVTGRASQAAQTPVAGRKSPSQTGGKASQVVGTPSQLAGRSSQVGERSSQVKNRRRRPENRRRKVNYPMFWSGIPRTNRKMAAQMDFCPPGRKVGSHGTANCPHGLNFRRTDGKMAARNDLLPHGEGNCPHRPVNHPHEAIFFRTEEFHTGCCCVRQCSEPARWSSSFSLFGRTLKSVNSKLATCDELAALKLPPFSAQSNTGVLR
jgi:hypothetical protein